MTIAADTAAPPSHRWLRLGLAVIAAIELIDALSGAQNIFTDYYYDTALMRFAQTLGNIKLALAPAIAATALFYAARGNVRRAILALAALVLMVWVLDDLPSVAIRGFELSAGYGGVEAFIHHFIFPAVALAGAVLAIKERRLALAGLLVSLPTIFNWASVAALTIAIMIYGF